LARGGAWPAGACSAEAVPAATLAAAAPIMVRRLILSPLLRSSFMRLSACPREITILPARCLDPALHDAGLAA
jgi:hypothetical protein